MPETSVQRAKRNNARVYFLQNKEHLGRLSPPERIEIDAAIIFTPCPIHNNIADDADCGFLVTVLPCIDEDAFERKFANRTPPPTTAGPEN
jgi:hypothetical protein